MGVFYDGQTVLCYPRSHAHRAVNLLPRYAEQKFGLAPGPPRCAQPSIAHLHDVFLIVVATMATAAVEKASDISVISW